MNTPSRTVLAASAKRENQPFLDGIRGLAAFYVLLAHCTIWGGGGINLPDPKVAVDVFMILSGYLMMHLATVRGAVNPPGTWKFAAGFWLRRFFRFLDVCNG